MTIYSNNIIFIQLFYYYSFFSLDIDYLNAFITSIRLLLYSVLLTVFLIVYYTNTILFIYCAISYYYIYHYFLPKMLVVFYS